MLVVTVELWPGGDSLRATRLGRIQVSNESGLKDVSDYLATYDINPKGCGSVYGDLTVWQHERRNGWLPLIAETLKKLAAAWR